ncbi:CHASE3 domain-containing protein [Actinomycetospora sp.]|uniref:sensor histidine kinase n=1 Tax=Actinomycetospora sp. TaxID=1872135 RepID=UPI002F424E40
MTLRGTVSLLVLVSVTLTMVLAVSGLVARLSMRELTTEMTTRGAPARDAAAGLVTALVDQETGSRGFVITGDPQFLQPYREGIARAAAAEAELTALLGDDPSGRTALGVAAAAALQWRTLAAQPQIDARRTATPIDVEAATVRAKALFDQFRAAAGTLATHLADQESAQLASVARTQAWADRVAGAGVVLALLVAGVAPIVVTRRLSDPIGRLQRQTRAVADGQVEMPIAVTTPAEMAAIAADVDLMRESLLAHREEAVSAQLELSVRETRDRLAAEVHDNTVQRLFALGLALDALAATEPLVEPRLAPLVDELDEAMRELRALIFGLVRTSVSAATLRDAVFDLTRDSSRALGFTPMLGIHGDPAGALDDAAAIDLLTVLREALSNIARHARAASASVRLTTDGHSVALRVVDDGIGPSPVGGSDAAHGHGIASMAARAVRRGGTASVRAGEGAGTVVEWRIPVVNRSSGPVPSGPRRGGPACGAGA